MLKAFVQYAHEFLILRVVYNEELPMLYSLSEFEEGVADGTSSLCAKRNGEAWEWLRLG